MPELPEVEVTRLSFADRIAGAQVLSARMGKPLRWPLGCMPETLVGRTVLQVRRRGLGIWDVYAACRREGSLDQAIEDAVFNDFATLRRLAPGLRTVAHNGGESARAMRHIAARGFEVVRLPSTSPANASWSFERKLAAWRALFEACDIVAPN